MKLTLGLFVLPVVLLGQPGWHTVKDRTGKCQISVPPTWEVLSEPGRAASPEHMATTVIVGHRPYEPWSEGTLKALNVDKVFENSATRSFYVTKASKTSAAIIYHIEVPGPGNDCIAEVPVSPSHSLDEIRKIALSLTAVK